MFSSHLLADPSSRAAKAAYSVLNKSDKKLTTTVQNYTKNTSGFLRVLVTGSPQAMGIRIVESMAQAAENYWSNRPGKNPVIVNRLLKSSTSKNISTTEIINLVQELQTQLKKSTAQACYWLLMS